MNKLSLISLLLVLAMKASAQFDPVTNPLVYHEPGMDKVIVNRGITFKMHHADTLLKFDLYYPAGSEKSDKALPVVIFNNGVGGSQIPDWKIYQEWARLMATHGMIGLTHQSRSGKTQKDLADLLSYLRSNASALKLDGNNIGIWMCSANSPTGWQAANDPQNSFIRAAAIYYGFIPPQQRQVAREDIELLLVRAGLDSYGINIGMEELMINALRTDAHVEYINYPEGQHAFDGVDRTARSNEIILQTVDFFKRNLLGDNTEASSPYISNRELATLIVTDNKVDEAITRFKTAYEFHNNKPVKYPFWNQLLNVNNLNGIGYELLRMNRIDEAIRVFQLNAEYFKDSPNVYDALGDAYERKGDRASTLANSRLALDKLATATNISPQFAQAIRTSAETKINTIQKEDKKPFQRAHHELVYDGNSKSVLLIGGSTPLNGGQSFRFFNDIWSFDGEKWKKVANVGDERSGIRTAFNTKRNKLYSYGGFTKDNQPSAQLRVLENDGWKILSDIPEMAAAEPGFVYDEARDRLIAFGGSGRGQLNGTTWEWNGSNWTKFDGENPEPRQAFNMVYDAKRKRTVLFGGFGANNKRFGDTWEFDGKKWRKVSDEGPGARMAAGATYDPKRGFTILFGGMADGASKNDTWAWDGKAWKKLAEDGPSGRGMGMIAYDKTRDRIVLFGGRVTWPNDVNDTWEWDGQKWTEVKPED